MCRDFTCAQYASVVLAAGGSAKQAAECTAGQMRVKLAVREFTLAYDQYTLITISDHPSFTSFGAFSSCIRASQTTLFVDMEHHRKSGLNNVIEYL